MSLQSKIEEKLNLSLKNKDKSLYPTLRLIVSVIKDMLIANRTKEEKKKFPGDAEAVEGMGSISSHKGEHLMPTDRGVMIYRRTN